MALTKLTTNMDIIAALDDEPNDVGGLTAAQLKAEFDESGNAIKAYINETLTVESDATFATKAEVQSIVLGQIPDGSLTKSKMETAIQTSLDNADSALQSLPSHTHGNITNDGKIGSTADLPVFTGAAGALAAKSIADAKTLLGIVAGAQIVTGRYTGTGTYGSGNENSLTFGFVPKLVLIFSNYPSIEQSYGIFIWVNGITKLSSGTYSGGVITASLSGNTLSWYSSDNANQKNISGTTYCYVAIG